MQTLVNAGLSAIIQIAVVLVLACGVYAWQHRTLAGFADWIGFKKCPSWAPVLAWAPVAVVGHVETLAIEGSDLEATLRLMGQDSRMNGNAVHAVATGGYAIAAGLTKAVLQTSLSEELLFRGLVGRRAVARLGRFWGNCLQATLFGIIHAAFPFFILADSESQWMVAAWLFQGTAVAAFWWGYVNERFAGGSILPGWGAHAFGNARTYGFAPG